MHCDSCDTFTTRVRIKRFQEKYIDTFAKYGEIVIKQTVSHFLESGEKVAIFCPFGDFLFKNVGFDNSLAIFRCGYTLEILLNVWFHFNIYSIFSGSLHNVSTSTPRRGSQSSITSPFSDTPRPAPKRQPATPTSARRGSAPPRRPSGTSSSLMKGKNLS